MPARAAKRWIFPIWRSRRDRTAHLSPSLLQTRLLVGLGVPRIPSSLPVYDRAE